MQYMWLGGLKRPWVAVYHGFASTLVDIGDFIPQTESFLSIPLASCSYATWISATFIGLGIAVNLREF